VRKAKEQRDQAKPNQKEIKLKQIGSDREIKLRLINVSYIDLLEFNFFVTFDLFYLNTLCRDLL
jgi:hypothetical protein